MFIIKLNKEESKEESQARLETFRKKMDILYQELKSLTRINLHKQDFLYLLTFCRFDLLNRPKN
jgi:hypothetical protein